MMHLTRRTELASTLALVLVLIGTVILVRSLYGDIPSAFLAGAGSGLAASYVAVANQFLRGAWKTR